MALTPSGQIAFSDVNTEINTVTPMATTARRAMNDVYCRNLARKYTSNEQIGMSDFYGNSLIRQTITKTFSANTADAIFTTADYPNYGPGFTDITIIVNPGIWLWASTNLLYGLTISGLTTGDTLNIVNQGYIIGCGGSSSLSLSFPNPVQTGGSAIYLNYSGLVDPIINNTYATAYIAGGGGAGQNGSTQSNSTYCVGGGGAGGGRSFANSNNIAGGAIGQPGSNGSYRATYGSNSYTVFTWGASGGRILPGNGGAAPEGAFYPDLPNQVFLGPAISGEYASVGNAGGAGGSGASFGGSYSTNNNCSPDGALGAFGGAGGSGNSAGGNGTTLGNFSEQVASGGGAGWGAQGGGAARATPLGGGITSSPGCFQESNVVTVVIPAASWHQGGKAVRTNGRTVTWVSGNTTRVYGAVS